MANKEEIKLNAKVSITHNGFYHNLVVEIPTKDGNVIIFIAKPFVNRGVDVNKLYYKIEKNIKD